MESSLLLESVHDVLKEESFAIPSLPAQNALLVANHLSKWILEHLQEEISGWKSVDFHMQVPGWRSTNLHRKEKKRIKRDKQLVPQPKN